MKKRISLTTTCCESLLKGKRKEYDYFHCYFKYDKIAMTSLMMGKNVKILIKNDFSLIW